MKKSIKILCFIATAFMFTSCDPDMIDAFADGYRQGYYGTSKASEPQTASDNETNNTEEVIELN